MKLDSTNRVHATYFHLVGAPAYAERYSAGDYLDRGWYYLLDEGQYYYLDRGQYNLLGELSYLLGHPALVKQASDRRIIDPTGTSHEQKKANVFRQIRVTKMSP